MPGGKQLRLLAPQLAIAVAVPALHFFGWEKMLLALARVAWLPIVLGAGGLVLAWVFNRERLFFGILLCLAAYLGLVGADALDALPSGLTLFALLAWLVPLNLLAASQMPRYGLRTRWSLIWFIVLAIECGLGAAAVWRYPALVNPMLYWHWTSHPLVLWFSIPQPALPVIAVVLLWLNGRVFALPTPTRLAFFSTTVFFVLAMHRGFASGHNVLLLSGGLLALTTAVLQESRHILYADALTGLPGRRALDERLDRLGGDFAVAMVDIDYFKRINDRFGHDAGDDVLRMVASCLEAACEAGEVYRYGGEEFCIVLPRLNIASAQPVVESARLAVAGVDFRLRGEDRRDAVLTQPVRRGRQDARPLKVTVSIGLADRSQVAGAAGEVRHAADVGLYAAKRRGRNRSVVYAPELAVDEVPNSA